MLNMLQLRYLIKSKHFGWIKFYVTYLNALQKKKKIYFLHFALKLMLEMKCYSEVIIVVYQTFQNLWWFLWWALNYCGAFCQQTHHYHIGIATKETALLCFMLWKQVTSECILLSFI